MKDAFNKEAKRRTALQNAAMHKYFTEIADILRDSGISSKTFLAEFEIDYSKEMIKGVWRAIALQKYGITSTADLTTAQLQDVYEEFNRRLAVHGLHLPFPSRNILFDEEFLRQNGIE